MKNFEKLSTIKALENAKLNLIDKINQVKECQKELDMVNTRANRKAVRRALIDLEQAHAKCLHIEIDLGYQTEKHNAKLRKVAVGEIIVKPSKEDREENDIMKKARELMSSQKKASAPMGDAMERYEAQILWEIKKSEKEEAKRIKREQRKAIQEEIRNARAMIEVAKKEEKKAEEARKVTERVEAEKAFAMGVMPAEVVEMVKKLDNYNSLIGSIAEQVVLISDESDDLRAKAREMKLELQHMEETLKNPMKSSKYRDIFTKKAEVEQKICANVKRRGALVQLGNTVMKEKKDLAHQIRVLKKNGNSAVRPVVRSIIREVDKLRKAKELDIEMRTLQTIVERVTKDSFLLPSFAAEDVLAQNGLTDLFANANKYNAGMKNGKEAEKAFAESKAAIIALSKLVKDKVALKIDIKASRPSRVVKNIFSAGMKIDTESKNIQTEWISIEHKFYTMLHPSWRLFSDDKKLGAKLAHEFRESVFTLLDNIDMTMRDESIVKYNGLYSSASHQKKEKLICCMAELMELHEELVWFGKTKAEILASDVTGAEIWKMRANMARPIACPVYDENGEPLMLHDIYMKPDVKKTYHHKDAFFIGKSRNGKCYERREGDSEAVVGDGGIEWFIKLFLDFETRVQTGAFQGGGMGVKGMNIDARDPKAEVERKHNVKLELPAGKKAVCGDGCFKFDKIYKGGYDEFAARMDELAERYPGINQIYALRQSEELDDDEKIRRLSRSLIQQLPTSSDEEAFKLAKETVDSLLYKKTFEGLFTSLAQLGIPMEKRNGFAKLIFECPELLTNINVQMIGEHAWNAVRNDAIGNKLRSNGQYPYIMQDPVALLEVWMLDMDPNDQTLGVLADGEVSVVEVKDGKKMVAIRYPANYLTAKVVTNKVLKNIFGSCGNVAILSIHDDILIIQDGDVDGDEMGFFYSKTLVSMVEKMRETINPPVVVFEHGDKAKRVNINEEAIRLTEAAEKKAKEQGKSVWKVYTAEDVLRKRMYSALHSAKEYDSVGQYANLARDCAYLLSIARRSYEKAVINNDPVEIQKQKDLCEKYLLWMAAASTGAILAIDQVKGNSIDESLINWLDTIQKSVRKLMVKKALVERDGEMKEVDVYASPYTQPFVKGDMSIDSLEPNELVNTDNLGYSVYNAVGEWEHDSQEFKANNVMLAQAILDHRHPLTNVRAGVVTTGVLTELKPNYFNRSFKGKNNNSVDSDAKIMSMIANHLPVGQKDLLLMYWRNMNTLEFRMQEKMESKRREEYYAMVRRSLFTQALSQDWYTSTEYDVEGYERGHKFTEEEKLTNVVNNAVIDALDLGRRGNGIPVESKASYAKFVLSVFAEDIIDNVRRNKVDIRHFMVEGYELATFDYDVKYEETDYQILADMDSESYPIMPATEDNEPTLSDDDIEEALANGYSVAI